MLLSRGFHPLEIPAWHPLQCQGTSQCPSALVPILRQLLGVLPHSETPLGAAACLQSRPSSQTSVCGKPSSRRLAGPSIDFGLVFQAFGQGFLLCSSFLLSSPQEQVFAAIPSQHCSQHGPVSISSQLQVFPYSAASSHPAIFHPTFIPLLAGTASKGFFPKVWSTCTLPGWDLTGDRWW